MVNTSHELVDVLENFDNFDGCGISPFVWTGNPEEWDSSIYWLDVLAFWTLEPVLL